MPESVVYLLRHGRTAFNATHRWQGQVDVPLDEVGLEQAEGAAQALATMPPSRIVSSDLSRAAATAAALARVSGVAVESDPRLREVHAGSWEGLTREEIQQGWPADLASWKAGEDLRIGGGERISEAGARVAAAVAEHSAHTEGVLVVVGHGGALRSAVQQLLAVGPDGRFLGTLRNAHWAVLTGSRNGWALDTWNAAVRAG